MTFQINLLYFQTLNFKPMPEEIEVVDAPLEQWPGDAQVVFSEGPYDLFRSEERISWVGVKLRPGSERFGPLTGENRTHFFARFPELVSVVEALEQRVASLQAALNKLPESLRDCFEIDAPVVAVPFFEDAQVHPSSTPGNTPFKLKVPSIFDLKDLDAALKVIALWTRLDPCLEACQQRFDEHALRYEQEMDELFTRLRGDWGVARRDLPTLTWGRKNPVLPRELRKMMGPIRTKLQAPGKAELKDANKQEAQQQLAAAIGAYERACEAFKLHGNLESARDELVEATALPDQSTMARYEALFQKEWLPKSREVLDRTLANPETYERSVNPMEAAKTWLRAQIQTSQHIHDGQLCPACQARAEAESRTGHSIPHPAH